MQVFANCSELEFPLHPVIEKGYVQAILLPVNSGSHDHPKIHQDFPNWLQVPFNVTFSNLTPEEIAALNGELLREKETKDPNKKCSM